ncbi:MAG: hypothetical protein WDN72_09305 [Alphaproteobacteria bacterium]
MREKRKEIQNGDDRLTSVSPRIGAQRELKKALESYWKGDTTEAAARRRRNGRGRRQPGKRRRTRASRSSRAGSSRSTTSAARPCAHVRRHPRSASRS